MINFYEELKLDQQLSSDELSAILKKERKKWATRQNAPDMNARQRAEQQLELINEAMKVLSDKKEKAKYDKELKKAMKKGQVEQTTQQPVYQGSQQQGNALQVLISLAEEAYNSGDSAAAINACQKALNSGITDSRIYYILGLSYIEMNDMNSANAVFRDGISANPDDLELIASFTRILAIVGNVASATTYLNILKDRVPNHYLVSTTLIEIELIKGNVAEAERLYHEFEPKHAGDGRYKQEVSAAYLRYMNRVFEKGYFDTEAQLDQLIEVARKRAAIDPANGNEDVNFLLAKKRKRFDWSNRKGIFCFYIIAALLFLTCVQEGGFIGILLMLADIAVIAFLTYLNRKPLWRLERKQITGKKDPIDYLFIIVGALFTILVVIWRVVERINDQILNNN